MKHFGKKMILLLVLLLSTAQLSAAESGPQIRRTAQKPFYSNGKRVEKLWQKADTLTGFVIPKSASVEPFATRVQMLYDSQNLYVSLCGIYNPAWKSDRKITRSLFTDNNFEFFIQPDPALPKYYQIAVSENGQIYTGVNRNKMEIKGVVHRIIPGKDRWFANLTIPFSAIGMQTPDTPREIRFNICRYNIDMPKNKEIQSSFAVLDGSPNYHLPDTWRKAVLTPEQGSASTIRAHSDNIKVNLLPDPGFDFVTRKFQGSDVQRVETMALSDIWVIRATGNAYHFYSLWVAGLLTPGKEYTLRVRGRRIGKEGAFGAIQLVKTPDGKFKQGGSVAWGIPFTGEFQEYYLPFKAVEGTVSLPLYRLGSRGTESGIEVENISLFEGRISSFEIRKVSRSGIKRNIPGTEIRFPVNRYGRSPSALNVLVVGRDLMSLNDPREIMNGLNVRADMLTTTGKNADVYYTDENPKEIFAKLKDGKYDLYMIGGRSVPEKIGKELAKAIIENVKKGAGLFLNAPPPYGNLESLVKNASLKTVGPEHYLKQALPVEFHIRPQPLSGWQHDPFAGIREGTAGKGRIVSAQTAHVHLLFQMRQRSGSSAAEQFPWGSFNKAWIARIMYDTANRSRRIFGEVKIENGKAEISCPGTADGTVLAWETMDKNGRKTGEGRSTVRNGSAKITLPALTMSGCHVLTLHALDGNGATLDYTAKVFEKSGPQIVSLKDNKLYYSGNDKADLSVTLNTPAPGMTLAWRLEDFSGRILESGEVPAAKENRLAVPLEALYTNFGVASVSLKQNGVIRDMKRIAVVAQDRDKARLLDDFTPSIWHFGTDIAPDFSVASDRQLEKIGFRCYLMPFRGMDDLAAGMGVGGSYRGGGDLFCGWPQKNNIRAQQINTKAVREQIMPRAERVAVKERQLGIVHDAVCDEPNFVRPGTDRELDEHPENIAEFRRRMRAKYGTIENYNKRLGTARAGFDEVGPARRKEARETGKYGEFIEWRSFNVDRWCEVIKLVADGARAGDPNSALSLYNSFGQGVLGGNDYWKLLTKTGLGFSQEYTSMVYQGDSPIYDFDEFYRSFRPDMRVWGFTGYFFSRDKSFFQPWWFALHRYGGFTWFAAFGGIASGGGGSWLNMLDYTGAYTEDAKNMQESLEKSNLLNGLGKLFLAYQWVPNDVAVYYSHESVLLAFLRGKETKEGEIHSSGPLYDLFRSRHEIRYLLEELLYQYDFLAPEQIAGGKLNGRKVLFLAGVGAMSDREVAAVKAFLAKGGTAIADFQPGEYDEVGMKRKDAPLAGEKNLIVLGKRFETKDDAQRREILRLLGKAGSRQIIGSDDVVAVKGREAMHFADGNMHVFAIARNQTRSNDSLEQKFTFPVKGHLYDLRAGKYLGESDTVTAAVPHGEASVWGVYPYRVTRLAVRAPETVKGGTDLKADIEVVVSGGKPGKHVFHTEVIPPDGNARFFMKRNLIAEQGRLQLVFRIAENDPAGNWTLRVTDVMTGTTAEQHFRKE